MMRSSWEAFPWSILLYLMWARIWLCASVVAQNGILLKRPAWTTVWIFAKKNITHTDQGPVKHWHSFMQARQVESHCWRWALSEMLVLLQWMSFCVLFWPMSSDLVSGLWVSLHPLCLLINLVQNPLEILGFSVKWRITGLAWPHTIRSPQDLVQLRRTNGRGGMSI